MIYQAYLVLGLREDNDDDDDDVMEGDETIRL